MWFNYLPSKLCWKKNCADKRKMCDLDDRMWISSKDSAMQPQILKLWKQSTLFLFIISALQPYPKVAGEELRTSGGTYAAVPTNVQALSSAKSKRGNELVSLSLCNNKSTRQLTRKFVCLTWWCIWKNCYTTILHRFYTPEISNFNVPIWGK